MNPQNEKHLIDMILANVGHLHRIRLHQLVEALGLYQGQPRLLKELWKQEGVTQTELAARMKIAPATITKMLQRMEKAGFIQRRTDEQDQRVSRVYLTETGRAVKSRVEEVFQTMDRETFKGLTDEEREMLYALLIRVRQNLVDVTGEEPWK